MIGLAGTIEATQVAGNTTAKYTLAQAGDFLFLATMVQSTTPTVSSVSTGGGVVHAWAHIASFSDSANTINEELWYTTVISTGTASFTIGWSVSVAGFSPELTCAEFSTGVGTSPVWGIGNSSGHAASAGPGAGAALASVTSGAGGTGVSQLYFVYMRGSGVFTSGFPAGGYCEFLQLPSQNITGWNSLIAPSTAYAGAVSNPTAGTISATSIAAIITATIAPSGGSGPAHVLTQNAAHHRPFKKEPYRRRRSGLWEPQLVAA